MCPKHLNLKDPEIQQTIVTEGTLELVAKYPALWVYGDVKGQRVHFEENFVVLRPGVSKRINYMIQEESVIDSENPIIVKSYFNW